MEAVYRVEKVSPITDSQGGNSGDGFLYRKKKKLSEDNSFAPMLGNASEHILSSRSAEEVFEGIMNL